MYLTAKNLIVPYAQASHPPVSMLMVMDVFNHHMLLEHAIRVLLFNKLHVYVDG